ncbi:MAG: SDR family oxidoreductase, partial [Gemmatimonadaceae bacterium]
DELFVGEATRGETLEGVCRDIDVVISALGLRSLHARPPAAVVDLRANLNILDRARSAGVRQFVFVAVLHGREIARSVPILRPREEFVRLLEESEVQWTVLRPTGAFNDMEAVFRSAKRGLGVVLGDGSHRINPVHAADIAAVAVRACSEPSMRSVELSFGGPETYSQEAIVREAFAALGARPRIVHMSPRLFDAAAATIRPLNKNAGGFLKFFRAVATTDMVGAPMGDHSLARFYRELASNGHQ